MSTQDEVRLAQLQSQVQNLQAKFTQFIQKRSITPGTNPVVTYDENGMIVSSRALQSSDIPILPLSKIKGLEELLSAPTTTAVPELDHVQINNPQLYTMLDDLATLKKKMDQLNQDHLPEQIHQLSQSYNDQQLQINTLKEDLQHLPIPEQKDDRAEIQSLRSLVNDLLQRVESQQEEIGQLKALLNQKANITNVTPGVYTKLAVTRDGTISGWQPLTAEDLPKLSIQDIADLQISLQGKADQLFMTNIANTVATITSQLSHLYPTDQLESDLSRKASMEDVQQISIKVDQFSTMVQNYQKSVDDRFQSFLNMLIDMNVIHRHPSTFPVD